MRKEASRVPNHARNANDRLAANCLAAGEADEKTIKTPYSAIATHSQLRETYLTSWRSSRMGQIISFPRPQILYPTLTASLHKAECVLLLAIRWWVSCCRTDEDPLPRLRVGLAFAGAADAALSIDGLMTIVERAVRRPVDVRAPRCPDLSHDETNLLQAAGLVQAGHSSLAERVLRTTLLSAPG